MTKENGFFEDLSRFATGSAGMFMDMKKEMESLALAQVEKITTNMNLVPRDEFDSVKAMATKAREENEALKERIAKLEEKLKS